MIRAIPLLALLLPALAHAQYFGRNKVHYDQFDFDVVRTEHFDLHGYTSVNRDAARMAERWYVRLAGVTGHEILSRQTVVLYADHSDFQQTNVVTGELGESTGGVTESLQRRIAMPLAPSYGETDHVLGHEIVHAFQYDMAAKTRGGMGAFNQMPLWMVEGMAEYLSVGRYDAHTAMWLRDAVLHDDVPDLKKLGRDYRYFPYRFGQAVWAYIGGTYGDRAVTQLFRATLNSGIENATQQVLHVRHDTLSARWIETVKATFAPYLTGRTRPDSIGRGLDAARPGPFEMMLAPALSPDGSRIAFIYAREFSLDLYLADAATGRVLKQLASGAADGRFDALSYMGTAGAWSPDGSRFAFVVFADGENRISVIDVESGDELRRYAIPGVGAIAAPAWSPDGRTLAFSGSSDGTSDLYLLDLAGGVARRLSRDAYADLQPAWSPDGSTIAFVTDRGPRFSRDSLTYETPHLALLDVATGTRREVAIPFGGHHTNPQFAPDGRSLYFLADPDGFRDLYRIELASGAVERMTRLATGITGLGALSPAMTIASREGSAAFTVFDRRGYVVRWLDADALVGMPVDLATLADAGAGLLPPAVTSRADTYLAEAIDGLPDSTNFTSAAYQARPRLSYVGPPTLGAGIDAFGVGVYANAMAYFQDVLGDHGLVVEAIANGSMKDLGATVYYENMTRRLNWGVGLGRTPYVYTAAYSDGTTAIRLKQRYTYDEGFLTARYPLSAGRRLEASAGALRISYGFEIDRVTSGQRNETTELDVPEPVTLYQGSAALVGDNSVFGIASPVQGGRYRFEVAPTYGRYEFTTITADWRRYLYRRPFTLAARAFHYGRYGQDSDRLELGTIYLGTETLMRGYSYNSFSGEDCSSDTCPEYSNLFGSRLAIGSVELRVPLIGNERYGIIDFEFLPTELGAFVDGGVIWSGNDTFGRKPIYSAGLNARFNVFGALIIEAYYAKPFQRSTGNRWGFVLTPGW